MKRNFIGVATICALAACSGGSTDSQGGFYKEQARQAQQFSVAQTAGAVSENDVEGQAFRLYQAAFDREPDEGGLNFWIDRMRKGLSLEQVSSGFTNSEEFKLLYGLNVSNEQFVTQLYKNVLDRQPDSEGFAYWNKLLSDRTLSREQVLIGFSESPENKSNTRNAFNRWFNWSWQETGSATFPYGGSVLGTASMRRPDGSIMIVFSGPTASTQQDGWFTCAQSDYRAVRVGSAGELADASALLGASHTAVHSREMVVADFNNDALDDMFSGNSGCDNWQILKRPVGEQNGLFITTGQQIVDNTIAISDKDVYTHSVTAAVTGYSSNVDVLVGAMSFPGPYILRGDGKGGFTKDTASLAADIPSFTASQFVDVNKDGKVDLVIGTQENSDVAGYVYLNDGHGRFTGAAIPLPVGINGAKNTLVMDIVPTDLNGDNVIDLILSTTQYSPVFYGLGKIQVLIGKGNGTFQDQTSTYFPKDNSNRGWIQFVHLVDLDADGRKDILFEMDNPTDTDIIAYRNTGTNFVAIPRSRLPASVHTLVPVTVGEKLTLVSLMANNNSAPKRDTFVARAYQFK